MASETSSLATVWMYCFLRKDVPFVGRRAIRRENERGFYPPLDGCQRHLVLAEETLFTFERDMATAKYMLSGSSHYIFL
jgi:hypothetical protein